LHSKLHKCRGEDELCTACEDMGGINLLQSHAFWYSPLDSFKCWVRSSGRVKLFPTTLEQELHVLLDRKAWRATAPVFRLWMKEEINNNRRYIITPFCARYVHLAAVSGKRPWSDSFILKITNIGASK